MCFKLTIPKPAEPQFSVPIKSGEMLFILGANGTGKSSLMHKLYQDHFDNARRISAHRKTSFDSDVIDLSPQHKKNMENSIKHDDISPESRWKDMHSQVRQQIAIYDLIEADNSRSRSIAAAVDNGDLERAKTLSKEESKIKFINKLLSASNISIEISIDDDRPVATRKCGSSPYSIAELSDGERNALLIAANVLTVKKGTLLLIDEPERHLHRSIISPLLTNLFSKRSDCAFVVSTHDVTLPLDNPSSDTLLIRNCTYDKSSSSSDPANYYQSSFSSWDADLVGSETEIDDDIKKDILGARRKILFIEGNEEKSLDKLLYSIVFPNVSIIPKSSCREVEGTVSSLRDSEQLNWIRAFGIVDNDRRTDIEKLKKKGIYALSVYSVESIYYHPKIQEFIAKKNFGKNASIYLDNAKTKAIEAIKPKDIKHLTEKAAEKAIREEFFRHTPKKEDISAGKTINVPPIDATEFVKEESERLKKAMQAGNLQEIISRYPVRESQVLDRIAKEFFSSRQKYEEAVRTLLNDEKEALDFVKSLFSELISEIEKG